MSNQHKLSQLISSCGGSDANFDNLKFLNDLEAGRRLLDWLSSQIDPAGAVEADRDGEDEKLNIFASTRDVVLEEAEVLLLNHARSSSGVPNSEAYYMPPSRSLKHAQHINDETDLVQHEADRLRQRIVQSKDACKKLTQSIKLLQRASFDVESQMRGSKERLSELSINLDTAIASTLDGAEDILEVLGYPKEVRQQDVDDASGPAVEASSDIASARAALLRIQTELSKVTGGLRRNLKDFASLREQGPDKVQELQGEVYSLQKDLNGLEARQHISKNDERSAIVRELEDICATLECEVALKESGEPSSGDGLGILLPELESVHHQKSFNGEESLSVAKVVQAAWMLDQEAILTLQEEILDEALSSYESGISPLERLHSSLSGLASSINNAEAALEALGEELSDIHLGGLGGADDEMNRSNLIDTNGDLEEKLKMVLSGSTVRQVGNAPQVLLTADDILAELRDLKARSINLETAERAWTDDLIHSYSKRPLHPILKKIYADSPLNTTPPFAYPAGLRELEAQTRTKTEELNRLANSLEDEVRETLAKQSHIRRLTTFIEKCADIRSEG